MINWPESLVIELAARRCVIFIGAGASVGAKRKKVREDVEESPPNWSNLLKILSTGRNSGTQADLEKSLELIEEGRLLESAEILRSSCLQTAEYNRLITGIFSRYSATDIHKFVEVLDQKVVVTTNFDTLYEDHCKQGQARDAYTVVKYYDAGLITRMRSPQRVIVKAHGCISQPEHTILTKSDFFRARAENQGFFKALESIFLTHTLLFIGYSISDPDIQLLLENGSITSPSDHPHYAVMKEGMHHAIKASFLRTNNVEIIEFDPNNDFADLLEGLAELCGRVNELRADQPLL